MPFSCVLEETVPSEAYNLIFFLFNWRQVVNLKMRAQKEEARSKWKERKFLGKGLWMDVLCRVLFFRTVVLDCLIGTVNTACKINYFTFPLVILRIIKIEVWTWVYRWTQFPSFYFVYIFPLCLWQNLNKSGSLSVVGLSLLHQVTYYPSEILKTV